MRSIAVRLGFAAIRANIAPPRLGLLYRYRGHWSLKRHLERLGITVVIDVGANSGMYAQSLRLMGFKGRIVSFEPNPSEYEALSARSSADPNWITICCAIGNSEGSASLNVTGSNSVYSSILTPQDTPPVSSVVPVPVHRLDGMWDDIVGAGDRVFLKTDTQGYDLRVLEGAGTKLLDVIGVQTELNVHKLYEGAPHYLDVLAFLETNGFSIMELRSISWKKGFIVEFDCFAARSPSLASGSQ